jgi:hypothetical protein
MCFPFLNLLLDILHIIKVFKTTINEFISEIILFSLILLLKHDLICNRTPSFLTLYGSNAIIIFLITIPSFFIHVLQIIIFDHDL